MSATNPEIAIDAFENKASKEESLSGIKNFLPGGRLSKFDAQKSTVFACNTGGKNCVNSSKIPRLQMKASCSCNESLNGNRCEEKTEKPPSMIPRSNSRKRNELDKVKYATFTKKKCYKTSILKNKNSGKDLVNLESEPLLRPNDKTSNFYVFSKDEKENLERQLLKFSPQGLKSCHNFVENKKKSSDPTNKLAQESIYFGSRSSKPLSEKVEGVKCVLPQLKDAEDKENDQRETDRQEKTIRNLYETIKSAAGSLFDNYKWPCPEKITNNHAEILCPDSEVFQGIREPDFSSIQENYDFTLREISAMWRNAISLICTVKDHAVKFVEENSKSVDKEQLTLEAEMLQLATDFAISYSKLKSDILIQSIRKRLNVKDWEKSELENFVDSKTFAGLYNNEFLTAMAQTVHDLYKSVLKDEELEME